MAEDTMKAYSSMAFAEYLSCLSTQTPLADSFGDRDDLGDDYPAENQHEIQKKHMITWFHAKGHASAQTTYNRLLDPAMRVWLAESVGVGRDTLEKALRNAGGKRNNRKAGTQAAVIRKAIPWAAVFSAMKPISRCHL